MREREQESEDPIRRKERKERTPGRSMSISSPASFLLSFAPADLSLPFL
jgi:hypothetical protein